MWYLSKSRRRVEKRGSEAPCSNLTQLSCGHIFRFLGGVYHLYFKLYISFYPNCFLLLILNFEFLGSLNFDRIYKFQTSIDFDACIERYDRPRGKSDMDAFYSDQGTQNFCRRFEGRSYDWNKQNIILILLKTKYILGFLIFF